MLSHSMLPLAAQAVMSTWLKEICIAVIVSIAAENTLNFPQKCLEKSVFQYQRCNCKSYGNISWETLGISGL